MLIKNEINRPLKSGATYKDAFERFLKVSNFTAADITDYRPATKPYLTCLGLKNTSYINNAMLIFLKNGEVLLYKFNVEKEES